MKTSPTNMKMMPRDRFTPFALALVLLLTPLASAFAAAAGGEVSGTVTDPKGAVIVGATVTVVNAAGATVATGTTDGQGRYTLPNVPPGTYTVVVLAGGFKEARRDQLKVEEGKSASADFKLEVGLTETSVTVGVSGVKANTDPVYTKLREQGTSPQDFTGDYAQVNNLVLKRDAAAFTLRSGELYFLPAVEGRVTGAIFIGDGEFTLTPPVEHEKRSLALFTGEPSITEQFTRLTLRFTDKTFDEIKSSPQARMGQGGPQSARARDIFRENQTLVRRELRTNADLRVLVDLYTPERPGFFAAYIEGKRFQKLIFQIDPLGIPEVSPEEVLLASYGESDGGLWTAFHLTDEYNAGKGNSDEDHRIFDISHHQIDAAIKGTQIAATDTVTLTPLIKGTRVLPFDLFRTLRVNRVRDEQGRDLQFIQESKNRDADFALIWPEPLEVGKSYKVTVEYQGGDALLDVGGGNFFLLPRSTWYPNNGGSQFGDRATFDMTFRYPKGKMLIGTGATTAPDAIDGSYAVARWSSGETELAVAGFNYGTFKKKQVLDKDTGYQIEFYANESLPDFMRGAEDAGMGSMTTTGMADSAIADAQNSTRIFNSFFGKLPYTRVAMTQQPAGNFGQAWPTLIYMPFTAFMDSTQRWLSSGGNIRMATNDFFRYVGPHEVAHQWWGHIIGWKSYRDQWMSEGFAEFSTSLYAQTVRRAREVHRVLGGSAQAHRRVAPADEGSQALHGGPRHAGLPPHQRQDRRVLPVPRLPEGRLHSPHAADDDVRPQDRGRALQGHDAGLHQDALQQGRLDRGLQARGREAHDAGDEPRRQRPDGLVLQPVGLRHGGAELQARVLGQRRHADRAHHAVGRLGQLRHARPRLHRLRQGLDQARVGQGARQQDRRTRRDQTPAGSQEARRRRPQGRPRRERREPEREVGVNRKP